MELKPGYKQTEVGVIPDEWEVIPLGREVERLDAGVSVNSVEEELRSYVHDESILKTSAVSSGQFLPLECKKIAPRDLSRAKLNPLADSIIISRMNTPDLVGECGYVASSHPNLFLPDRLWMTRFRSGSDICVRWLNYLLSTKAYKGRIKALATGTSGSMKNIAKDALLAMPIPYCHGVEQRAIADALGDVDALLRALTRLIAKKRDLKQAAMQQLLTGQHRLPGFSGEWEVKRFGDLFQFLNTANNPRADLSEFGDVGYIHYGDIHTSVALFLDCVSEVLPLIAKTRAESIPLLQDGDLVMADASEDYEGIGKCVEIRNATGRRIVAGLHTFLLRGNRNLLADGFKGYLQFIPSVKAALVRFATGISVYGISKNNVRSIEVLFPSIEEQTAIAAVLSDMDAEIAALEARLAKTRALKQGMMQELLTGKTRLV